MGDLAYHLLELYKNNDTQEFSALCKEIDHLILDGDKCVSELAVIGILEGIQNVWGHSNDPELFYPFLYPESKKRWKELNDFWSGKITFDSAGLQNDKDED